MDTAASQPITAASYPERSHKRLIIETMLDGRWYSAWSLASVIHSTCARDIIRFLIADGWTFAERDRHSERTGARFKEWRLTRTASGREVTSYASRSGGGMSLR